MLEKIKLSLRIENDDLDEDIIDLIEAAKSELILSGVRADKVNEDDPLILRAIKVYCKSEYSENEQESQRYMKSFEMLKVHLTLSIDYTLNEDA